MYHLYAHCNKKMHDIVPISCPKIIISYTGAGHFRKLRVLKCAGCGEVQSEDQMHSATNWYLCQTLRKHKKSWVSRLPIPKLATIGQGSMYRCTGGGRRHPIFVSAQSLTYIKNRFTSRTILLPPLLLREVISIYITFYSIHCY